MLYITLNNNKKRLYINITAIKNVLIVLALTVAMFYISNQEYLDIIH